MYGEYSILRNLKTSDPSIIALVNEGRKLEKDLEELKVRVSHTHIFERLYYTIEQLTS